MLHLLHYARPLSYVNGQTVALVPQPGTGFAQRRAPAGIRYPALRDGSTPFEHAGSAIKGRRNDRLRILRLLIPSLARHLVVHLSVLAGDRVPGKVMG
jgi:hypothetical protein